MEYLHLLLKKDTFLLFLAPPGWGKTQLLKSLYGDFNRKIIFVSPLRALAEEFFISFKDCSNIFILRKRSEKEKFNQFLKKRKALIILTPEMFYDQFLGDLGDEYLIVLDEFHLFYLWGEEFRPILFEVLMGLAGTSVPLLGLSATVGNLDKVFEDFTLNFEHCYLFNLGNQQLLRTPKKIFWFLSKKVFNRRFIFELGKQQEGTILYFCQYREEVDRWIDFCKRKGINVLGCKGGEVAIFIEDLKNNENPSCIFATTALSHGVNLPSIRKVFIGYKVGNKDFWIQMTGRGGRRGESFDLYHFDGFLGSKWNYLRSLLLDLVINKIFYASKIRRPSYSQDAVSGKTSYCETTSSKWKKDLRDFLRWAWKKRIP